MMIEGKERKLLFDEELPDIAGCITDIREGQSLSIVREKERGCDLGGLQSLHSNKDRLPALGNHGVLCGDKVGRLEASIYGCVGIGELNNNFVDLTEEARGVSGDDMGAQPSDQGRPYKGEERSTPGLFAEVTRDERSNQTPKLKEGPTESRVQPGTSMPLEDLFPRFQSVGPKGGSQGQAYHSGQLEPIKDQAQMQGGLGLKNSFSVLAEPGLNTDVIRGSGGCTGKLKDSSTFILKEGLIPKDALCESCPRVDRAYKRIIEACSKPGEVATEVCTDRLGRGGQEPQLSSGDIATRTDRSGEILSEVVNKKLTHGSFYSEPDKDFETVGARSPLQGNVNICTSHPSSLLETLNPILGEEAIAIGSLSNWDRLAGDETKGLLVSLLRMRRDELEVVAALLDAQPLNQEIAADAVDS